MRCYGQYCPVAHALDLVGDRWALLIVRDLCAGPKRYTDLLAGLPGIGTNILAARLRELEQGGVVRKTKLPPPAASTVYELTEYGAELDEVVHALARWGARSLGPPEPEEALGPGWLPNAVRATFDGDAARDVTAVYELQAGDELATITVSEGRLTVAAGPAESADARIETDPATLFRLVSGELAPADALRQGAVRVDGEPSAVETFFSLLSFEPRGSEPAAAALAS
jgi:DNA-binding HxlR family transcriptional regulator